MPNESADGRSYIGKRAIVIGAGVSGLAAARAVADHFEEVVVLERDELPSGATTRPGVPQGTQAHGLLGGALKGLRELFPGFDQDLAEAGAVPINVGFEALQELPGFDPFPMRKWNWSIYSLTRPLIELIMRQRIEQQQNISLRGGSQVFEIVGTPDGDRVTGVRCQTAEGPEEIQADLVIDASKHGSLTLLFLKSTGQPVPAETAIGVDIRYATARFELRPGALGEFKACVTFPKPPEEVNAGYLLPVENSCYQLLLIGRGGNMPPTEGAAFLEYARKLSTPSIYNAMKGSMQLGEVARYGFPESKWRHFGLLDRFPRGLLPTGDAICCLNPVYGQGITVAVMEANAMRRLLRVSARKADPLAMLGSHFLTEVEALLEEPWTMSAIPDFVYPKTRGERPKNLDEILRFQNALVRVATRDADLAELLMKVRHLLEPMSTLNEPDIVRRVEAEMAANNESTLECQEGSTRPFERVGQL
jgi:flavin-dependent dehydrogenase